MKARVQLAEHDASGWQQVDLYRFFAFALAAPSEERFRWLARPELSGALEELWRELGCSGRFPGFRWFGSYAEYEAAYIALFDVGLPEPPVPLFESAHDKTRPPQEIALENTCFYEVLGLKPDAGRSVPDYLITQLEFLAALRYTREHSASPETARDLARTEAEFLERHLLNWVPAASKKLQELGALGFRVLIVLLLGFLAQNRPSAPVLTAAR